MLRINKTFEEKVESKMEEKYWIKNGQLIIDENG